MKRLAILLCLLSTSGHAVDGSPIHLYEMADSSCKAWSASARTPASRLQYVAWAQGFISVKNVAINHYDVAVPQAAATDGLPPESISRYLDKFCRANPLQPFTSGVIQLTFELQGLK
ncbi:hypothetical protein BH10PSE17_BH10PSE17_02590 [soil metagenome]